MDKQLLLNFDFDGVLADSFDHLFHMACETHRETGIGRQPEVTDFTEASDLRFSGLANLSEVSLEERQQFAEHFYRKQSAYRVTPELFPGITTMLASVSQRHTLNVISAGQEEVVQGILADRQAHHYFGHIHGGNRGVPKSESLKLLMDHYQINAADTYMIGDAVSDITQGQSAGVRTIAVTWGYQSETFLLSVDPDYIVSTPDELTDLVARLAG